MIALFKRNYSPADLFTIAANLLPIAGVWFWGWNAVEVFTVYAMETLIVGIITVFQMGVVTVLARPRDTWYNKGSSTQKSGFFFIFFFIMHYGIFAAVQSSIFAESANIIPPGKGSLHFFFHWYSYINGDIALMLGAFVISYIAQQVIPFLSSGAYKTTPLMVIMFMPYGRIIIQQFTVIIGSMFLAFGWGKGFILVFAVAKLLFDLYVNMNKMVDKTIKDMDENYTQP